MKNWTGLLLTFDWDDKYIFLSHYFHRIFPMLISGLMNSIALDADEFNFTRVEFRVANIVPKIILNMRYGNYWRTKWLNYYRNVPQLYSVFLIQFSHITKDSCAKKKIMIFTYTNESGIALFSAGNSQARFEYMCHPASIE